MNRSGLYLCAVACLLLLLAACSSVRHVPQGMLLLDDVKIVVDHDSNGNKVNVPYTEDQLKLFLRQQPNHRFLWSAKLQLGVYNMSGRDSTKWYNKWIRRIGEAPVIYSPELTDASASQLRQALINKGYLSAEVEVDTLSRPDKRKMNVVYRLKPGTPHRINSITYDVPDDSLSAIIQRRLSRSSLTEGAPLDMLALDAERERITTDMRNRGYYGFSKEQITFSADTTAGSWDVDLTVSVDGRIPGSLRQLPQEVVNAIPSYIKDIYVVMDYNGARMLTPKDYAARDTIQSGDLQIISNGKPYLRPSLLRECCYLKAGAPYRQRDVSRSYEAFGRLSILKFVSIQLVPTGYNDTDGHQLLTAYILLTPGKTQTISAELEGTNSEGDLGVAASLTYTHRNLGRGSETFTTKLRGAYESLSGDLSGLIHNRYMEFSVDVGVDFPKFKAPFLSSAFKNRINATTRLQTSFNYQERPEYTRLIANIGFSYNWASRRRNRRHSWTPIDINYVYLPESTQDFIQQIAPNNPLLRYSYEDHFIMSMGYRFYYSSRPLRSSLSALGSFWDIRVNAETAGNLLYAINNIFTHRNNAHENPYEVFGIRYSQYVKAEANYAFTHVFDSRNTLAFHAALGVAYPYGNSTILPFEKRFYGGGANGVRGWDVRTLGPGSYDAKGEVSSFINQCGDILLTLSAEYRAKLFWVIEGALFVDAGNIWTIHAYETQPGGMFHFSTFYKQLAAAYGVGIRLNFNYFLLRFDLGMKAHNPAKGQEPWPLIHPRWGRDSSFHFSIGYPF